MARNEALATRFFRDGQRLTASITIQRSAHDLYETWRSFQELPRFIDDIESVTSSSDDTLHWTVQGPSDRSFSWDAKIIADEPDRRIAWTTDENSGVPNAGTILFRELPFCRGTEVRVIIEYLPPGGATGEAVAKFVGKDPKNMLRLGLLRFRQLMEAGELSTSVGQSVGKNPRRKDRAGEATRDVEEDVRDLSKAGQTQSMAATSKSPASPSPGSDPSANNSATLGGNA
ncbi:MAG: SRPBCC family protein [Planctomycetota bacterium]|nr:SRPBCC family protein [Planctomycetota bacterium]